MNYYNTLGINKNASEEDIKTAYRKMAMKHHPDRGGDEKKFKQVEEAYRTLSDPEKRRMVDMGVDPNSTMGHQGGFSQGPFEFHFGSGNWDEVFGGFGPFGFGRQQPRNKTLSVNIQIDLLDIINGKKIDAEIATPDGRKKLINIEVPPGIEHGQQIRYKGMGDNSIRELPPGDLIVTVVIREHPIYQRQGDMIIMNHTITVWDAILGCETEIVTLDYKKLNLKVPPGTQPDTVLSCKGEGLPNSRTRLRGNLLVKVKVEIPRNLSEEQIKLLGKFKNNGI